MSRIPGDVIITRLITFLALCLPIGGDDAVNAVPSRVWSSRVVTTKLGLTRGYIFTPSKGGSEAVEIFLGLPYASPPTGSLRLMPPHAPSPWSGTRMSPLPAPVCPQVFPLPDFRRKKKATSQSESEDEESGESSEKLNETQILKSMPRGRLLQLQRLQGFLRNQSEDCLYLNIYVPISVSTGKVDVPLPVLVFIHGDDYSYGAGLPYDPSMLVAHGNIIVITLAFRLGILGFLNANSDSYFKSPANFALLDQIAALQFVQDNIASFGGDRGNVTLMGHGKGAEFVNFLMISNAVPSSEHGTRESLFHRVILMSGSALSPFTVGLSYGKDLAKKFAERLHCPVEPPSNMLQCLRQLPLQYFLDSELWKYFGPSDDGVVIESGIRENVLRDRISRFPMIFGVTKAEFLPTLTQHDAIYGIETEKRREVLKQYIDGFYSSGYRTEILAAAIHEYTDWERAVQHPISVRDETLDALADAQIVSPMVKVGELHSQGSSRTYFYVFEYQSKGSDYVQRLGCVHGEDLPYVFGVPGYLSSEGYQDTGETEGRLGVFSGNYTKNEVLLSGTLVAYWVNFIKTGNPNSDPSTAEVGLGPVPGENRYPHQNQDKPGSSSGVSVKPKLIEWPPYDSLFKKYLSIETKPKLKNHYRAHKLSFWLYLVPELMRNGGGGMFPNSRPDSHIINSSTSVQHPPSIQLVGPPYWEQHPFYYSGNFSSYPGGDVSVPLGSRPHHRYSDYGGSGEGFQIYSTALSVTIAVGCSLLILNILVFAAFYYFRDKYSRPQERYREQGSSTPGPISLSDERDPAYQGSQEAKRQSSYEGQPSIHSTPVRVQENGQILNYQQQNLQPNLQQQSHPGNLPMPNICGDLPNLLGSSPNPSYQQNNAAFTPNTSASSSLQSSKRPRSGQSFELSMPDAILAAAMMLNYRQNANGGGGTDYLFGTGHKSGVKRPGVQGQQQPGLNLKEQLLLSGATSGRGGVVSSGVRTPYNGEGNVILEFDSGSLKSGPKPPKRGTPTVKFSPETFTTPEGTNIGANIVNINAAPVCNPCPVSCGLGLPNLQPTVCTSSSTSISCSSSSASSITTGGGGVGLGLKSSLKKHSSYSEERPGS